MDLRYLSFVFIMLWAIFIIYFTSWKKFLSLILFNISISVVYFSIILLIKNLFLSDNKYDFYFVFGLITCLSLHLIILFTLSTFGVFKNKKYEK